MLRPNGWIVGLLAVLLVLVLVVSPEARTPESTAEVVLPASPNVPLLLGGCPTIASREAVEDEDCLQAARLDLIAGQITVGQALDRLEWCTNQRPDLAELRERSLTVATDRVRAQVAFGDPIAWSAIGLSDEARRAIISAAAAIPDRHVERLRAAGITPAGMDASPSANLVRRLTFDQSLRESFRAVFGDFLADDLDALLARAASGYPSAVAIGGTFLVPNLPEAGGLAAGLDTGEEAEPLIVSREAYLNRVVAELRGLEGSRLRFLATAAREHHEVGSVAAFLTVARTLGRNDGVSDARHQLTERDRLAMMARLSRLERRLGLDPLLYRAAQESIGTVAAIDESCEVAALSRKRWVRRGAGALTGLLGAAGVVVATGATGTLLGGVTIAAALEAAVGAYFVARTEGAPDRYAEAGRLASLLPGEVDERTFRRPDLDLVLEQGESGEGAGEYEGWFSDEGPPSEWEGLEAEGVEEELEELTEQGPRENTIAPILPVPTPAEMRELPPLLEGVEIQELAELSLPEIQERLERFLAIRDPAEWTRLAADEEELTPSSLEEMIEEARSALRLWERERVLSDRFGAFFIQAELEQIAPRQRQKVLARALGRYSYDRQIYVDSRNVDELRTRMAVRLVANCRAERAAGDLVLSACTEETALSVLIIAALRDAGVSPPPGSVVGIQAFGPRFEAVLYDQFANRVFSLTKGTFIDGVVAPIFHPATFYYTYLVSHNVVPEIDSDQHLLIALPDRPMPESMEEECRDTRSVITKAVEWVVSRVGIARISSNPCDPPPGNQEGGGGEGGSDEPRISISMPMPQNPFQRGGGSSGGGQGGGSGGGGGQSMSPAGPRDASSDGASSSGGEPGGGKAGGGDQGSGESGKDGGQGASASGVGVGNSADEAAKPRFAGDPTAVGASSDSSNSPGYSPSTTSSSGSGGSGGFSAGNVSVPGSPNLSEVGNSASVMISRFQRSINEGVAPWRLREDEGMMTGSTTRVLYADNDKAMERFAENDLFITLTPAEVEAQRRMLEADGYIIYPPQTDCDAIGLPPRRVFRRMSPEPPGFRYVYCDHDESKVVFREQSDAEAYANFIPPDRPLYLASLATERLEAFQKSVEVGRLQEFLQDPNVVRQYSRDELYAMVRTAADLLVFQNALQSALVQSMNELGESNLKGYYFEMHRQVLQAPLFIEMAQNVYRLNQRLASDPLQSLSWANAQPALAKRGFFDLYHTLGGMMEWPERWATLQDRYANTARTTPNRNANAPSLDFLQILSDPTRVQIDWHDERVSRASISDTQMQDGLERTTEIKPVPTASESLDRQDEDEHLRGGTSGLGRAGEGESLGPERGRQPLQMIYVRIAPEDGEPDRRRVPEDNQVKPGGTEGEKRTQTKESATRQEPILWVSPSTFVEALLSTWDNDYAPPEEANRIPPMLRFSEPLREIYLRDFSNLGVYENRLRTAMQVFTRGEWLEFREVREAMGGSVVSVRARDTGRFSAAYSGNAPINDQDQIRVPNFFTRTGVIIPEDLFAPVREHYRESILGIFDLAEAGATRSAVPLSSLPLEDEEGAAAGRNRVLRSLELVTAQAAEAP